MDVFLQGKKALVCGSSQGIGRATAHVLAGQGAEVILLARNEAALKALREQLPTPSGQQHSYLVADFSQPRSVESVVKDYLAKSNPIEVLINNTGGPPAGPMMAATPEQFLTAYHMHLLCNHLLVQALAPGMKAAGYGRIIQIISTSVKEPIPNLGVSNTTRGAVAAWAKTLAGELGPWGITVNNVLPGFTDTQRLHQLLAHNAEKAGQPVADVIAQAESTIPLRRFAAPEEIAQVVAFLASPAGSYVNGVSLPVDGGRTKTH